MKIQFYLHIAFFWQKHFNVRKSVFNCLSSSDVEDILQDFALLATHNFT